MCRTSSSAVGTSTITTPDPQFESVAVAVPSRNGGDALDQWGHQRIVRSTAADDDEHERRAEDDRGDGRRRRPPRRRRVLDAADREADTQHQEAEGEVGHVARGVGRERRHQPDQQRKRDRQQHDVHAEERPPGEGFGEQARDQRAARAADAAECAPDPDREGLVLAGEHRVDGGQRRGEAAGRRHPLQRVAQHHHEERVAHRADRRRDPEAHDTDEQDRTRRRTGPRCDRSAGAARRTPGSSR